MSKSLQVVPSKSLLLPNGSKASIFSAHTPGQKMVVSGWTWRKIDARGKMTEGLCRIPAKTREEAEELASSFCEKFGFELLPTLES